MNYIMSVSKKIWDPSKVKGECFFTESEHKSQHKSAFATHSHFRSINRKHKNLHISENYYFQNLVDVFFFFSSLFVFAKTTLPPKTYSHHHIINTIQTIRKNNSSKVTNSFVVAAVISLANNNENPTWKVRMRMNKPTIQTTIP